MEETTDMAFPVLGLWSSKMPSLAESRTQFLWALELDRSEGKPVFLSTTGARTQLPLLASATSPINQTITFQLLFMRSSRGSVCNLLGMQEALRKYLLHSLFLGP